MFLCLKLTLQNYVLFSFLPTVLFVTLFGEIVYFFIMFSFLVEIRNLFNVRISRKFKCYVWSSVWWWIVLKLIIWVIAPPPSLAWSISILFFSTKCPVVARKRKLNYRWKDGESGDELHCLKWRWRRAPLPSGSLSPSPSVPSPSPQLPPDCSLQVMELLQQGNLARTTEPTAANRTSSRSHAVLQVSVRSRSRVRSTNEEVRTGRLFLIDLAGSERASHTLNRGKRLVEGAHINRSLLALGNCINALSEEEFFSLQLYDSVFLSCLCVTNINTAFNKQESE